MQTEQKQIKKKKSLVDYDKQLQLQPAIIIKKLNPVKKSEENIKIQEPIPQPEKVVKKIEDESSESDNQEDFQKTLQNIKQDEEIDLEYLKQQAEIVENNRAEVYDIKHIFSMHQLEAGETKILNVRYDPVDNYFAVGSEDGTVRLFTNKSTKPSLTLSEIYFNNSPVTNIRWRPFDENSQIKNILLSTHVNGEILHWHAGSKKILSTIYEENNQIYALDFNSDGTKYATGGQDCKIKIYEENKGKNYQTLEQGSVPAHTNRIYSIKFIKDDPNVLLSAGWDQAVILWDLRTKSSEQLIYGPKIYGDSLDYKDNKILTGSYRDQNQLELWDIRIMQKLQNLKWYTPNTGKDTFVYACQFSKVANQIVAGSTGNYAVKLFEERKGKYECIDTFSELDQGVFTIDFQQKNNSFGIGCSKGYCSTFEIQV